MNETKPNITTVEYAKWVARNFIRRLTKEFPGEEIEKIILRQCSDWNTHTRLILMRTAMEMFINDEL